MIDAGEASEGTGAAGGGAPLGIRLLGPWDVRLHGRSLRPLRSRKGEWLLAVLVLNRGRAVSRDWLAGTLWPDSPNAQALYNLRRNLSDLRRALGPEGDRLCASTPHTLSLDLEAAWVDVAQFDELTAAGDGPSLAAAVRLYGGPLLPDCLEAWVLLERTAREQAYLGALESLARAARQRGDHDTAAHYLQLAVTVDPLSERARAALMEALAARGDILAATRVYHEFRRLLRREMNAAPGREITAVYESVCSQTSRPEEEASTDRNHSGAGDLAESPAHPLTRSPAHLVSPSPASNLPQPVSSFVGRESQLAEIVSALRGARLLTLTGPGGVGKTRLAIRAGENLLPDYPHGVWFVDLAGLAAGGHPALVAQAVAGALGVSEQPNTAIAVTVREFLRSRRLLLILDNCEHLLDACAGLTAGLLEACPELRLLATSRQPLGLFGEVVWPVPPLSMPGIQVFRCSGVQADDVKGEPDFAGPEHLNTRTPEYLLQFESVRLFVERGHAAARGFALTEQNAAEVTAICRRLDGLPLALELAAARLRALSPAEIAARLGDRFRLVAGGNRAALPRHQTLRAAIGWSYDLLSEPERCLLRALSVFPASFTLEAAEAVVSGQWSVARDVKDTDPTLTTGHWPLTTDLIVQLVDRSLVMVEAAGGSTRYRLLETVREYAAEQLSGEELHRFKRRHAEYYSSFAPMIDLHGSASEVSAYLDQLEREHDHLRAAVDWAVSQGEAALAWRLGAGLGGFWHVRGYWREGRKRLTDILSLKFADAGDLLSKPLPLVERAHTLDRAADLAVVQNDDQAAQELFEQSMAIYRRWGDEEGAAYARTQLGSLARRREEFATARARLCESLRFYEAREDRARVAWVLSCLGHVAEDEGDHASAVAFYRQSLAMWREVDNLEGVTYVLMGLGRVVYLDGDFAAARALFTECLTAARELRNGGGVTFPLYMLGSLARLEQEYAQAAAYHREALELYRELGDESSIAGSLAAVAFTLLAQGDGGQAAALFKEALQINQRLGNRRQLAHCLEGLAGVATGAGCWVLGTGPGERSPLGTQHPGPRAAGDPSTQHSPALLAARLFGAAAALRERDSSRWPADQADYERNLAALQARLDPAALAAAWQEGAALPLDEAMALALASE